MVIIDYFEQRNQDEVIEKIAECDWGAARFLSELLRKGTFFDMLGGWGSVYLLMDGDKLVSFATLTGQDCIRDENMTPWIGFVYTKPEYRGQRMSEQLLRHCERQAAARGFAQVYVATDHVGLYEKYGYSYLENRLDYWGDDTRILYKPL